jgi:hypothetical protein
VNHPNEVMNALIRGRRSEEESAPPETPRRAPGIDGGAHEPPDAWATLSPHQRANEVLFDALAEYWRGRRL